MLAQKLLTFYLWSSLSAIAAEGDVQPFSFEQWKETQIAEATSNLFRASSKASKAAKPLPLKESTETVRLKPADREGQLEKDRRRAKESLDAANNLEIVDYVTVYLPTLRNQPEQVQKLVDKLPKEELAAILRALLTNDTDDDAKRNQSLIGVLSRPRSNAN